jgi:hypothetical protein
MPDAEVPSDQVDPAASLDLLENAQTAVEGMVSRFRTDLTKAARRIAFQDDCDAVSVKHARKAEIHVCRLLVSGRQVGVNPHIWWLASGVSLAIALAIPDAAAMFIGSVDHEPVHFAWKWLPFVFVALVVIGLVCAAVSFLIALGPYQPKWFTAIATAVERIASKE